MINNALIHCKANSIDKITLEVNEKNTKAINFYKKKNFINIGRRRNYYELSGISYDAILMEIKV
jgi:ribosomal protein S18 acetylase RimI-like enzyme